MADNVRLIFAEDDMEDRMIIEDLFKNVYPNDIIHFAEDGIHLLDSLDCMSYTPSLIVLDLNMPRMNGVETLRELKDREAFKNIPVIILSTSVNERQKRECLHLGAVHYLTKPFTYDESLKVAHFLHNFAVECSKN